MVGYKNSVVAKIFVIFKTFSDIDALAVSMSESSLRSFLSRKRVSPKKFEKPSYNGHILGI